MGLYKEITTDAGSTLNYWDFGIVEVNTAASKKEDQNAVVNIWGYHDVDYYNAGKPLWSEEQSIEFLPYLMLFEF